MPCPTLTVHTALLSSADHLQLCLGPSQPTRVLSGLVLLDPILSGSVKSFPSSVATGNGVAVRDKLPFPSMFPPIALHHLLSHSEQLPALAGPV